MVTVDYHHEIPYDRDVNGRHYPRLTLRLANLGDPEQAIDLDAYLDSGAERSLFDGTLALALGIDLLAGQVFRLQSTTGHALPARLHTVHIAHALLGSFAIEVAFSAGPIGRNLLGRDFFSRVQVGFRESRRALYVTALP
ncbi:MAG: retroviral-like aspartic protease family protein [Pseudomonadota bacterium]|nr:retroviral-like aspartic protease family protein [Pseudomonadota bacterium]